jgi:hypothetical protein
MNREDIIRMAREAWGEGAVYRFDSPKHWPEVEEMFVRFAALVAAAEREACALAAEAVVPRHTECGNKIAAAIRARGQG